MPAYQHVAVLAVAFLAACGGRERSDQSATANNVEFAGADGAAAPPTVTSRAGAPEEQKEHLALARLPGMSVTTAAADSGASAPSPETPQPAGTQTGASGAASAQTAASALVIRTGTASVEVDSLEPAVAAARVAVGRLGGWVANASFLGGEQQVRSATLELKVPAARFDALTGSLGALGKLERLDVSAEDVGEEYVDVSARVANARRLEERLIDLLARSAGRLADVLAVERELARVREEIERYEGRLRFLRTRAATSTLTIALHEPAPLISTAPGANPIAAAFRQAWRNFVGFLAWLIAALGIVVPLAAIGAVVWVATRPLRRRRPPGPSGGAAPPAEGRRDRAA